MDESMLQAVCPHVPHTTYETQSVPAPMRVCVIDLGTNSFHAIIVDAYANGSFKVVDRMKEMVRLGDNGLAEGRLADAAMERGLQALKRIYLLAKGQGAQSFSACATSAIREAANGGDFITQVKNEIGLRIEPISGAQEAHLIYEGVRRAVDLSRPSVVVDIGGGSVEFVVCTGSTVHYATSLKLGAARMTEIFVDSDPMSAANQEALRTHFRDEMAPVLEAMDAHGVVSLVGSSGTVKSLARVCLDQNGEADTSVFEVDVPIDRFQETLEFIIGTTSEERETLPAVSMKRVGQVGAGAVLLDVLLHEHPFEEVHVSAHALREGMVVQFIDTNHKRLQQIAPYADVRRRSIHEVAFRFDWDEKHTQHVAATALYLFQQCIDRYTGPPEDRELLEYAAILHDVGYYISHSDHHLHSRYLIRHADLRGFYNGEVDLISLVARYHRAEHPLPSHPHYGRLAPRDQKRVTQLAGILRIAEALDRSHYQNVTVLSASAGDETLAIDVRTKDDPELETWAVREVKGLFEEAFDLSVTINGAVGEQSHPPEQPPETYRLPRVSVQM
ncbi:MAG: Ppx/GppA phosphatase family protein [Longimonas sp.]|uniref:Ppx/GppA phosphatase family protein n=1 Tax=Longimonas sp. TaxID=2039626 RepID=UPI00335DCC21